jgi:hypothetical protein
MQKNISYSLVGMVIINIILFYNQVAQRQQLLLHFLLQQELYYRQLAQQHQVTTMVVLKLVLLQMQLIETIKFKQIIMEMLMLMFHGK